MYCLKLWVKFWKGNAYLGWNATVQDWRNFSLYIMPWRKNKTKKHQTRDLLLFITVEGKDDVDTWMKNLQHFFMIQKNWNVGLITQEHRKHVPLYREAVYKSKTVHRVEMSMLSRCKLSNHTEVWQMFFLVPFF